MKQFTADLIKNVAISGHGGSGKTTLAEAMLFLSGATDRLGRTLDGNTVLDFDSEEKRRAASVSTAIAPAQWKDNKINIIDTPGMFDFAGGIAEGIRACDTVLIALSGKSGVTVGAEKAYKAAVKGNKAKMFFISKLDSEHADYKKVLSSLTEHFGTSICPVVVPIVEDHKVTAYVNLINGKKITYKDGKSTVSPIDLSEFSEYTSQFNEAIAGTDEELMEKFFADEPFTPEEIIKGLNLGVRSGDVCPVFCGSGLNLEGVDVLLDGIHYLAPSAAEHGAETAENDKGEKVEVKVDENGPLAAVVFKTIADPFVGKLSYFKVISGKVEADMQIYNPRTGSTEKIPKVFTVKGAKQEETPSVPAGDIGAVAKVGGLHTGDTMCSPGNILKLAPVDFPAPCISMAVKPKKKGEEEKIVSGLNKLMGEDPTISQHANSETHEQILCGLGEQHLDVIISKLRSKYGVEVELSVPRVAYRETIRKPVKIEHKYARQSGGRGQYGHVYLEIEPQEPGKGYEFVNKIVGGVIPKEYIPAVDAGVQGAMESGVLAGYSVVDVKVTLYDGSYHEVDSSEMAFKIAGSMAFKEGCRKASPVLLEPIMKVDVIVPEEYMGDVMGDLNSRRGQIQGMEARQGAQAISAMVPLSEMFGYATELRSRTQGRGQYTMFPSHYAEVPKSIQEEIMKGRAKD